MLVYKTYEDAELLELLREDNQVALQQIYDRYWKRLYLAAFSILREDAPCQDIVQEVLLQLWLKRGEVEIATLRGYLFQAVRYKVLTYIKSAGNRKVYLEDGELERLAGITELGDGLDERDIRMLLDKGVAELPERARQVFIMSRNEHMTNKEIAEQLGISVKAVEAQITLALKYLRRSMGDVLFWAIVILPEMMKF